MKRLLLFTLVTFPLYHCTSTNCQRLEKDLAPLDIMFILDASNYSPWQGGYYRSLLYKMEKDNPHFFKMSSIKDNKEYFIDILRDHIVKLEKKLAENRTGFISKAMFKGSLSSFFTILTGYGFYWFYSIPRMEKSYFNDNYYDQYRWEDEKREGLSGLAISMIGCGCFAGKYFRKVWRHKKRVLERIERDIRILSLLEQI